MSAVGITAVDPTFSPILPSNIAVGGSPFSYTNADSFLEDVIVAAGTVSEIAFSRDETSFFVVASATGGMWTLSRGDTLRVTYTVAPTMTKVPR